jgi:hypothetical protein
MQYIVIPILVNFIMGKRAFKSKCTSRVTASFIGPRSAIEIEAEFNSSLMRARARLSEIKMLLDPRYHVSKNFDIGILFDASVSPPGAKGARRSSGWVEGGRENSGSWDEIHQIVIRTF